MKVLIAAGGSGGHLFPALRLAEEIRCNKLGEILFVTTSRRFDTDILQKENMPFVTLPLIGFQGRAFLHICNFLYRLAAGSVRSLFILLKFRPRIVVGFGGYVSGPVVLEAALLGIGTIIHEQNIYPGRTTMILARFVDKIAVSFPETSKFLKNFKSKITITGNLLRRNITDLKMSAGMSTDRYIILTMGGSQGACLLDRLVPEAVALLREDKKEMVEVIHIAGEKAREIVARTYRRQGIKNQVVSFTMRIDELYKKCDFVISRAGATTVSELLHLSKPAILIPYPHRGAHQLLNARILWKAGAAILLEESNITAHRLCDAIEKLMNRSVLEEMSGRVKNAGKYDGCNIFINEIFNAAEARYIETKQTGRIVK